MNLFCQVKQDIQQIRVATTYFLSLIIFPLHRNETFNYPPIFRFLFRKPHCRYVVMHTANWRLSHEGGLGPDTRLFMRQRPLIPQSPLLLNDIHEQHYSLTIPAIRVFISQSSRHKHLNYQALTEIFVLPPPDHRHKTEQ